MWYWHTPFELTGTDRAELKQIGVKTLYVRAGTLASDGQHLKLILPQQWKSSSDNVVLTFNFHPGLVSHLESMSVATIASESGACIQRASASAAKAGISVQGVQLDIDCPTRLLPRYKQIIDGIRPTIPEGETYSITALPTWLTSKNFPALASSVDFVVPQFYEGRTGKVIDEVAPITDPAGLKAGLARLDKLGIPNFVGLATYGHALQYDDKGRLVSMVQGLSAEDALRHPALAEISSAAIDKDGKRANSKADWIGEDLLLLKAIHPDRQGRGLGNRLAFLLPSPTMVQQQLAEFRKDRPQGNRGVILYRFPESGEAMSLPLASIANALHSKPAKIDAKISFKSRSEPWSLIGTGAKASTPPYQVKLMVTATGDAPTTASHDAFELVVTLDSPGLEGIEAGDFDKVETGSMIGQKFLSCSPATASVIRLWRFHLLPGDRLNSGLILVPADRASHISATWSARGPGGFQRFSGQMSTQPIHTSP